MGWLMNMRLELLALGIAFSVVPSIGSRATSPIDREDAESQVFRKHCRDLLAALGSLKKPMPAATDKAVKDLLDHEAQDLAITAKQLQDLLDPFCLLVVTINPESRVKAARGAAPPELKLKKETIVLVKVVNEAGVTHALQISGPELRDSDKVEEGRWLAVVSHFEPPLRRALSGHRV
jgi:hypothetical protein